MSGKLIVISGPSGVGKSTIVRELARQTDAWISVSATTRNPGIGEKHGENYYFLSHEEFRKLINDGQLLEYAQYMGNYYGTLKEKVESRLNDEKNVILEIEVEGAKEVAKKFPDAIIIYLLPPENDELAFRLTKRAREDKDAIKKRFENAQKEIDQARSAGVYKHWVVNDIVRNAVDKIVKIIRSK